MCVFIAFAAVVDERATPRPHMRQSPGVLEGSMRRGKRPYALENCLKLHSAARNRLFVLSIKLLMQSGTLVACREHGRNGADFDWLIVARRRLLLVHDIK